MAGLALCFGGADISANVDFGAEQIRDTVGLGVDDAPALLTCTSTSTSVGLTACPKSLSWCLVFGTRVTANLPEAT